MNNIPSWWDKTITIYNKIVDIDTQIVTWKRTILKNCFWKHNIATTAVDNTLVSKEILTCRIPQQPNFISPLQWKDIDCNCCAFTLQPNDIIVLGECHTEIDEYQKGERSTDLLKTYRAIQGCLEIQSVSINTMSGMQTPHYNVTGI